MYTAVNPSFTMLKGVKIIYACFRDNQIKFKEAKDVSKHFELLNKIFFLIQNYAVFKQKS